jgi:hypothetical protein
MRKRVDKCVVMKYVSQTISSMLFLLHFHGFDYFGKITRSFYCHICKIKDGHHERYAKCNGKRSGSIWIAFVVCKLSPKLSAYAVSSKKSMLFGKILL